MMGYRGIDTLAEYHKAGFQSVTIDGTSAQATNPVPTDIVTVISTTACYVNWGSNPTAAADATSLYLPADMPIEIVGLKPGIDKVAFIQSSAGGIGYVYPRVA